MNCNDKKKFKTAEASTKASLRTKGAIDKFLNILDYNLFNNLNNKWTDNARQRFNISGKLFYEENNKALPNKEAFKKIDNSKGIFYQTSPNQLDYTLRATNILQSDKAKQVFAKGKKNGWDLNKILTELQVPKEQKQIILDKNIKEKEVDTYGQTIFNKEGENINKKVIVILENLVRENPEEYLALSTNFDNTPTGHIQLRVDKLVNSPEIKALYTESKGFFADKKDIATNNLAVKDVLLDEFTQYFNIVDDSFTLTRPFGFNSEKDMLDYISENPEKFVKDDLFFKISKGKTGISPLILRNKAKDFIPKALKFVKPTLNIVKSNNLREEIITSLLADNSFVVEVNTAKEENELPSSIQLELGDSLWVYSGSENAVWDVWNKDINVYIIGEKETPDKINEYFKDKIKNTYSNTQYYSNLTVPGGTNYTENEIATPAITPNIKGHAQFSTDNGIGWFRSDDASDITEENKFKQDLLDTSLLPFDDDRVRGENRLKDKIKQIEGKEPVNKGIKTRRILEVQSDLFQKGRDKKDLFGYENKYAKDNKDEKLTPKEKEGINKINSKNQFLQLLNKKNNWVTFFIKSIIQDSAKKGYEKVLFPKGDTAAKIEGHQTLEEFKRQKEARIKELEQEKVIIDKNDRETTLPSGFSLKYTTISLEEIRNNNIKETETLKKELSDVESGKTQLSSIANFYETTVANILKKNGYNPVEITDEYGNKWNEIEIVPEIAQQSILLQETSTAKTKASPAIIAKVKEVIKKMGVNLQDLSEYAKNNPNIDTSSINAIADLISGVIAVAEGKEDVALTEEMIHIATAIIEQKNPQLITEMISKIGRFKIYKDTLEAYKNIPAYQLENGKPNIRKIKKEAVDKLIAEIIMNDGSLSETMEEADISIFRKIWNIITDWFRGQYKKANIDIFSETAKTVIGGEFEGSILDLTSEEIYYQVSEQQKSFQRLVQDTQNFLRKKEQQKEVDPVLLDEEDATNFYEYLTNGEWKRVANRVTDEVKAWYNQRFRGKTFTELEKRDNEVKRKLGTKYHIYFEEIHARFFNTDGTKRTTVGQRPVIKDAVDDQVYTKLEKYYTDLIADFSKDGKKPLVFSEVKIYDPIKDQAGTIDLLIVEEDGTANIYDWKFMSIAKDAKDIAWYKQGAYNEQLTRYGEIIKDFYGVENIRKNRAIPIIMELRRENPQDTNTQLEIKKIEIGSVNPKKLESLTLVALSQKEETTGIKELDELVKRLNVVYDKISKKKVKEDDRLFKKERLNILREAIRSAQGQFNLGPLTDVINIIRKEGENLQAEWENNYKNRPAKDPSITQQELNDFSEQLLLYKAISEEFGRIDDRIGHLIYVPGQEKIAKEEDKENLEFRKEKLLALSEATKSIRLSREEVEKITGDFGDKFQGLRNNVTGLLSPTGVLRGLASRFRSLSEIDLPSLKILSRLVTSAQNNAAQDSLSTVNRIMDIRQRLINRGDNVRQTIKKLYQKDDKGGLVNLLIQRYDKKFYEEVKNNGLEGRRSKKWLIENIDTKAYMAEANEKINKSIEYYEKTMPDETIQASAIKDVKERYDINNPNFKGWDNEIVKRHPLAKWESKEYLEIKKDKDIFDLYQLITEMNNKASEIGYIQNRLHSVFLPFVRKSMAEGIAWGTGPNALMNFSAALTRKADDVGYGSIDELTKELENSIPKYYTTDISQDVGGMENVSLELFKNLILYSNQLEKYKYMSEVEDQLQLVKTVMKSKSHYKTSWFGNVDKNQLQAGNEDNLKIFDEFLQTVLYGVKYAGDPSDFSIPAKGMAKALNSVVKPFINRDVFDENESNVSLVKSMDALNKAFQLKTLGLEPISGAVNAFGGVLQIATQAGNYFKARELYSSVKQLVSNKFKSEDDRELFIQMVDLFMPLKDDPSYDKLQEAGLTKLTRQNFSDILFAFFRQPEQVIEKSLFLTFLNNMMIQDGKIVSIREFVKNKYKDRYDSSSKFRGVKSKIDSEIEQLKKTSSLNVTAKLENGKLVIPGLNLNNREEIQRLTNLTRTIARNATGGYTEVDTMRVNMNIWTKSMMVFKGWIPKLVDTRFGEFRKVSDDFSVRLEGDMLVGEKYDIGRIRLFSSFLHFNILKTIKEITDIIPLTGDINDEGLAKLDEMFIKYSKQYEDRTGQKLNMTREEFIDLIRNNLRNQVKELSVLMVLFGSLFSLGFFEPEDDDDKASKNFFRYSQRTVNRFIDELMFFYNPAEWEGVLSNGMIPSLGLFSDMRRFTNHFFRQTTGIDRSDLSKSEVQVRKEAQPIKYAMRMFPFTKSLVTWLAIIDSDFAKDFDVTISKTPR